MPNFETTNDLFAVRRAMITARELASHSGTDSWNDSEVQLAFVAHFGPIESPRARLATAGQALQRSKL